MSSIRKKPKTATTRSRRAQPPRLELVRGGRATTPRTNGNGRVRDGVIDRARSRVSAGYYDRPRVQRALVDTLWKELCDD